jgi:glycosyltransferase involved in cell wall biosynthesis
MQCFRILFDGHSYDVGRQGTTSFIFSLIDGLLTLDKGVPAHKIEIHFASATPLPAYLHELGVKWHRIDTRFLIRNTLGLPMLSLRINPDVTISQYVCPIFVRGKSCVVIHDVLFLDFPSFFSFSYILSKAFLFFASAHISSTILTVSNYSRDRLSVLFLMKKKSIYVCPNSTPFSLAANPPPLSAQPSDVGPINLIYVARLELRKRHEWIIELFNALNKLSLDFHITVVGSGPRSSYANGLRNAYKACRLKLTHLEEISTSSLESFYRASDLLVYPSLAEGFGIPVIEAASLGLPVVMPFGTVYDELAQHCISIRFDPVSFESFLGGVLSAISNLSKLTRRSRDQAGTVSRVFSSANQAAYFMSALYPDFFDLKLDASPCIREVSSE